MSQLHRNLAYSNSQLPENSTEPIYETIQPAYSLPPKWNLRQHRELATVGPRRGATQEEGCQYDVLTRSKEVNDTLTGKRGVPTGMVSTGVGGEDHDTEYCKLETEVERQSL